MGVLDSIDKRIDDETKIKIIGTTFDNEHNQFYAITRYFEKNGRGEKDKNWCKNSAGEFIECKTEKARFMEDSVKLQYKNVEIEYQGRTISYWFTGDGEKILLGSISPSELHIPEYGDSMPLEVIGEMPLEQVKSTMIEMIEQNIRKHPVLGKYADIILNDFNQILSIDQTKGIKPLSDEKVLMAGLQSKVDALKEEVETLKQENVQQQGQIGKLQAMLSKTLTFATSVRDSFVGKIFFKNKIAQLDLPNGALPQVGDTTVGEDDDER